MSVCLFVCLFVCLYVSMFECVCLCVCMYLLSCLCVCLLPNMSSNDLTFDFIGLIELFKMSYIIKIIGYQLLINIQNKIRYR